MNHDLVKRLRLIGEKRLQCTACYKFIETADEAADRIERLEAALRWICGSRTIEYFDGTCSIDETKMLWTYRRIARGH